MNSNGAYPLSLVSQSLHLPASFTPEYNLASFKYNIPCTVLNLKNPSAFFDQTTEDYFAHQILDLLHTYFILHKNDKSDNPNFEWYFKLVTKYFGDIDMVHGNRVAQVFRKVSCIVKDKKVDNDAKERTLSAMKVPLWLVALNDEGNYQINDAGLLDILLKALFKCWNSVLLDLENQIFEILTSQDIVEQYGTKIIGTNLPFFHVTADGPKPPTNSNMISGAWVNYKHDDKAMHLDPSENIQYYIIKGKMAPELRCCSNTSSLKKKFIVLTVGNTTSNSDRLANPKLVLDQNQASYWDMYHSAGYRHVQLFYKPHTGADAVSRVPLVIFYKRGKVRF